MNSVLDRWHLQWSLLNVPDRVETAPRAQKKKKGLKTKQNSGSHETVG